MPRYAAKVDTTSKPLVKHARKLGADVVLINGVVDALIWWRGVWHVVDFKSPGGSLTDAQAKLVARGLPIRFISTTGQLEALLGVSK